jgi:hypothetical protein
MTTHNNHGFISARFDCGVFTFQQSDFIKWLAKSNKCGDFFESFVFWLSEIRDISATSYCFTDSTVKSLGLQFFIDTIIESKRGTVICQFCNLEHEFQSLVYEQYGSGTWLNRQLKCTCEAVLYDATLVSFQLRDGRCLPTEVNRVID